jgi:hypothetical protein
VPQAHQRQRPGRKENTTWSPSVKPLVFSPTATTTPAPSWPPQKGYAATGISPVAMWSSEWHHLHLDLTGMGVVEIKCDHLVFAGGLSDDRSARLHR